MSLKKTIRQRIQAKREVIASRQAAARQAQQEADTSFLAECKQLAILLDECGIPEESVSYGIPAPRPDHLDVHARFTLLETDCELRQQAGETWLLISDRVVKRYATTADTNKIAAAGHRLTLLTAEELKEELIEQMADWLIYVGDVEAANQQEWETQRAVES